MERGQIYVITHKPVGLSLPEHYTKLYVGATRLPAEEKAALKGYRFDDSGEHISGKNRNFCELTGLYWIWKNQKAGLVGITHYRRFFVESGRLLTMGRAEAVLKKADIIVAKRQWVEGNAKIHFERFHSKKDFHMVRQVIKQKYPDYLDSFDEAMGKCFLFSYNMMVCKKDVFDGYCAWLFDILEACEAQADLTGYDQYQQRIFGFLSERLLMVYLLHHKLSVAEMAVWETEVDKSTKWESKKWEMITVVKNFWNNHGIKTMRYGNGRFHAAKDRRGKRIGT